MKHYIGEKVLVTTNGWFYGPDGKSYRAIWGTLKAVHTTNDTLGFTPSRNNTNWMAEIGGAMIAGCQVLYFVLCPNRPDFETATHVAYDTTSKEVHQFEKPNEIYLSE